MRRQRHAALRALALHVAKQLGCQRRRLAADVEALRRRPSVSASQPATQSNTTHCLARLLFAMRRRTLTATHAVHGSSSWLHVAAVSCVTPCTSAARSLGKPNTAARSLHSPTHPSMNTSVFNIKRERGCEEKAPARAQESRFGGRSETPPETPSGPLESKPMPAKVTVHGGA